MSRPTTSTRAPHGITRRSSSQNYSPTSRAPQSHLGRLSNSFTATLILEGLLYRAGTTSCRCVGYSGCESQPSGKLTRFFPQYAIHLVATLKNVHQTKLPITIVHAGGNDLTNERRAALRSISPDVETVDILHFFDEKQVGLDGGGWAIKVFAILSSKYREVIICDADAVFLQDPVVLFEDPGYNRTGTLFFRDREIFPGDGNVHDWWAKIMEGRTPSPQMETSRFWTDKASREEMESGVVVFDKRRREVALGLVFTGYLNIKTVREAVTYAQTYGALYFSNWRL